MRTVIHNFKCDAVLDDLVWPSDPTSMDGADEPAWAVWETACRRYRVVLDGATNAFSAERAVVGDRHGHECREWSRIDYMRHSTYSAAAQVAERCHREYKHA